MTYLWLLFVSCALVFFFTDTAHAYIDPSSGSYFLQFIIAGLLGAAFTVKAYWRRIISYVHDHFRDRKGSSGENSSLTR